MCTNICRGCRYVHRFIILDWLQIIKPKMKTAAIGENSNVLEFRQNEHGIITVYTAGGYACLTIVPRDDCGSIRDAVLDWVDTLPDDSPARFTDVYRTLVKLRAEVEALPL